MNEGSVVICGSGQAGTLEWISGPQCAVILTNGEIWHGPLSQCRIPQDQADLEACPLNVERLVAKPPKRSFRD